MQVFLTKTAANRQKVSDIMNTYEAWVMMDAGNDVITDEHDTPQEAINELKDRYTIEEMREAGITCNRLLCDGKSWIECLEEIEY